MEKPLQKEFNYFLKNQDEFVKKYNGKFIVIKNEKIIGVYDSQLTAYNETIKTDEIGTFLIQLCIAEKDRQTQTFHSRVIFA